MSRPDNHTGKGCGMQFQDHNQNSALPDQLRRTRTRCCITVLVVLGYMSYLTVSIRSHLLRPKPAAEFASRCVSALLTMHNGPDSDGLVERAMGLLGRILHAPSGKTPDEPVVAVAGSLQELRGAAPARSQELLSADPAKIEDIARTIQNPKTVQELGKEFDAEIGEKLVSKDRPSLPDPLYLEYVCRKMATLSSLEWQLNRLAHADDLTPYEKNLRLIIAAAMGSPRKVS